MRKKCLIIFLLWFIAASSFAELNAAIDRDQIGVDEILTLTIKSDERLSGKPDWNVLSTDFHIISTSQQSHISIINGKMSSQVQWVLAMLPKHPGIITIPAFQIGSVKSQPLEVKVTDLPSTVSNNHPSINSPFSQTATKNTKSSNPISKDIFMEVSLNPKEAYVKQQLTYTVKLYFKRKIDEAFLMGPSMQDATVTPIGEDIYYSTVKKGQLYRVLERSFVIIPQQNGKYDVTGAVLTGVIEKEPSDIFDFGNFMAGVTRENIKIVGAQQHITIKNKPASFNNQWWLPAKQVSLEEDWTPNSGKIHVGDPITREIYIRAVGVKADALPKIEISPQKNLNIYSEPVVTKTETDDHNLTGSVKQKIVMVPTQAGVVKIPEIKLSWWNTTTHSMQTLRLPGRTITVLPVGVTQVKKNKANLPPPVDKNLVNNSSEKNAVNLNNSFDFKRWLSRYAWLFAGLFLVAALLTLLLRKRDKKSLLSSHQIDSAVTTPIKNFISDLQKACKQNDADRTRHVLISWAKEIWPDARIISLLEVVKQLENWQDSATLRQEILGLDRCLYTDGKQSWQGNKLWEIFVSCRSQQKKHKNSSKENDEKLPPLYLN